MEMMGRREVEVMTKDLCGLLIAAVEAIDARLAELEDRLMLLDVPAEVSGAREALQRVVDRLERFVVEDKAS